MIARCSGWVLNMAYGHTDDVCLTGWKACEGCPENYTEHPDCGDVIPYEEMDKFFVTDPIEKMAIEIHE